MKVEIFAKIHQYISGKWVFLGTTYPSPLIVYGEPALRQGLQNYETNYMSKLEGGRCIFKTRDNGMVAVDTTLGPVTITVNWREV